MRKEDARVIRTKNNLLTTFRELLSQKSFEDITVNEICDRANVRRATFYKHFDDKYAFLKYLVGYLRDRFDEKAPQKREPDATSSYYVDYLHGLVNFLIENESLVNNLLESEALPTLVGVITEKNYEDTCVRLRKSVEKGMKLPASVEITASMMTGAVASTLLRWFKSDRSVPIETVTKEISAVISSMQN